MLTYYLHPLKNFHTLAIKNIIANKIVIVNTIEELIQISNYCIQNCVPFLIIGKGSNTFFTENYLGTIIVNKIRGFFVKNQKKHWVIHAFSGEKWHNIVKKTLKMGFYGLENLALIPGCIGSAVIQNIGAYGVEIKSFCYYVDILCYKNLTIKRIVAKLCQFNYRNSTFKSQLHKFAIIAVGLRLKKIWTPNLSYYKFKRINTKNTSPHKIFNMICLIRKKILPDPNIIGNAGSFFKNPIINVNQFKDIRNKYINIPHSFIKKKIKLSAGWLIYKCYLNGFHVGGAETCKKRPIIIINKNNANSNDVLNLSKKIFFAVKKKFNIKLELEVELISKYKRINFLNLI